MFTSCSSIDSDAKKLAKEYYNLWQIEENVGSKSKLYIKKSREVIYLSNKMLEKYNTKNSKKEFTKSYNKWKKYYSNKK